MQVLNNIASFPTVTTVVIISNEPDYLRRALRDYQVIISERHDNLTHPYRLPWISRGIMEAAYEEGGRSYTCCTSSHIQQCTGSAPVWAHGSGRRLSIQQPLTLSVQCGEFARVCRCRL